MSVSKVKKRDGRIVDFNQQRITDAVHKAFVAINIADGNKAEKISNKVTRILKDEFEEDIPSVEDIQDIVIKVLRDENWEKVAEEYSDYREKKKEIRQLKKELGIEKDPKLAVNALEVLKKRYLLKNKKGEIIETPIEMFHRVAEAISEIDKSYNKDREESYRNFFEVMSKLEFLPNSPTLFNANASLGQLSACFVLPVDDSLESIFTAVKNTALIEKTGGGVGFDFSSLRPRGDVVKSTKGVASGPVSFMKVFDKVTEVIKAGGKRRGAMMGVLRVDHPDIEEFISAKSSEGPLSNFNFSVAITVEFMKSVENDEEIELINPRTNSVEKKVNSGKIWDKIVENAWKTGDPGILFIDEINEHNPTLELEKIRATNPCGEVPLLSNESCNLGSVNLSKMIKKTNNGEVEVDWERLERVVKVAVHFLDNVIDANEYPLSEIEEMTKANRKIGLGVMGWAELLIKLDIPYDSEEAISLAGDVMSFISEKAREKSRELGEDRGSFPNFEKSIWSEDFEAVRNATVTSIAPTGSISIIAGCSSSIEPLFSIAFMRNVLGGTRLFEINPLFEKVAKDEEWYNTDLMKKIAKKGSIQDIEEIPEDLKRIFVTALDIAPKWHVKMQASFQKYVDNAVSKTVNLPKDAKKDKVKEMYELAWKLNCKGITIYKYGSKKDQVLYIGEEKEVNEDIEFTSAESEYSGGAVVGVCPLCG
ncbi:hypothetical protein AKJ49_01015 [candidate division MSBL1 archaeon SCGC-AAA382A03]|uniref:Vitamin B12-dependent ribonucleotide reductase n=1 Tax=candidate division MSBL1 archaeon SCGC-AAA382A03 TaxID=1698278 RepID=A0A133VFX0_9EURY|nr:hypothetical protein AKJ49_01015 [candidate division MSBL1 archaeon SCGC-AAA382A03]